MKCEGNCPVQGNEIRDGWLLYFRARDGWELQAWKPGSWAVPEHAREILMTKGYYYPHGSDQADIAVMYMLVLGNVEPTHVIDESNEADHGFPEWPDDENDYPGWWSVQYANAVAEWSIRKVMQSVYESPAEIVP